MTSHQTSNELLEAARIAHGRSYSPYSRYRVGAALSTDVGVIAAPNVENAAYPLGTCAEAGAISGMIAAGGRRIGQVVIVTDGHRPGTPCGGCRQRLREFAAPDVVVSCHTVDGRAEPVVMTMAELLPASFGPEDLDIEDLDIGGSRDSSQT